MMQGTLTELCEGAPIGPDILEDPRLDSHDREQLRSLAALLQELSTNGERPSIWTWAALIADAPFDKTPRHRKPLAKVTTLMAAQAYEAMTGLPVTRVSKEVPNFKGAQEVGPFAIFLKEVFTILGVNAKPAGQVRLLMRDALWKQRPVPR